MKILKKTKLKRKNLKKKVAKKNNLKTIDLYTATAADRNLIQEDGIHPNAAGARRMAEVVGQAITDDR